MNSSNIRTSEDDSNINEAIKSLTNQTAQNAVIKELEKRLLLQRHFNEFQICIDKDESNCNSLLQKFCEGTKISYPEELEAFLERTKQTKEFFIDRLIYDEQINQLKKMVINSHNINDFFLERKMRQDSVLFSLIRLEKETIAREVYYRLKDDLQDFGELAKQFSAGTESKHGGVVGPIQLQTLNPELRSRLIALQEGDISEPFTIDGKQYLIIKLIRFDRMALNNQIENVLRDDLFEQWLNKQLSTNNFNIHTTKPLS